MKRFLFTLLALGVMTSQSVLPVHAQATPVSEQAVLQKQSLTAEIADLAAIYRGQLAEYRAAEKEFQIAKDQYQELKTLASINTAAEAAKKVMRLRSQVLLTYFELLRVNLIAAEAIELSLKQTVVARLEAHKVWLQANQAALVAANDRETLNALSDAFTDKQPLFAAVAKEAGSLLAVGKLQNVLDRLALIGQDLTVQEASNTAVIQGRPMRETNRLTTTVQANLRTVWTELTSSIQANEINSFYDSLTLTLNPVYADLNKLVSFLEELLRSP